MIDPTFRNNNRLLVHLFKAGENNPVRNSFDKYYIPLVKMTYFYALIKNESFLMKPWKANQARMKNLSKYQERMIIQQELISNHF